MIVNDGKKHFKKELINHERMAGFAVPQRLIKDVRHQANKALLDKERARFSKAKVSAWKEANVCN